MEKINKTDKVTILSEKVVVELRESKLCEILWKERKEYY